MIKVTVLASALALAACGGSQAADAPAAPAAPLADEAAPADTAAPAAPAAPATAGAKRPAAQVATDALAFIEAVSAIVIKNDGNCDGMGDELTAHMATNQALVSEMKVRKDDPEVEAELNNNKDRMMAAVGPMMGPLSACKDNPKVKSAMETL